MIAEAWDPVFNLEQVVHPEERALAYLTQAGNHVVVAEPFKVPKWDARQLMERLLVAEDKAGGLNG